MPCMIGGGRLCCRVALPLPVFHVCQPFSRFVFPLGSRSCADRLDGLGLRRHSFAKTLFPALGAAGTVTYRVTIGAAILLAFWRPWRLHLSRQDAGKIALYGVTLASMNLLFYLSLGRLPIGIAIAIEFTGPLVLAVALSRRVLDFVWIGLAVVGLLILTVAARRSGGSTPWVPPTRWPRACAGRCIS